MKRSNFIIAVAGTAVLAAGLTAWGVSELTAGNAQQSKEVKVVEFAASGVGNHFTAYEKGSYPDLTYAAENAVKAVVNVEVVKEVRMRGGSSGGFNNPFFEFFGVPDEYFRQQPESREQRGGGSGVIIGADGYIVTNNHVIDGATKLKVRLNDNRTFDARLIGSDPATDVALIKIEAEDLPTLVFGNSNDLRLGEWVLAIGSPFDLTSTVTAGIVSAKARDMREIPGELSITSFIQTDAAVNPGNSGGALVNVHGEVVGINTMIKSPTGSFAGYSFAIPSSIVQKVVIDLKEYGVAQRALLGIMYQQIDNGKIYNDKGEQVDVDEQKGLYVSEVMEDSGAEAAGMKAGDVITSIDGIELDNSAKLQEYIATKRPNEKVNIFVIRDGKVKQFDVVLRNKAGKAELLPRNYTEAAEELGGKFADIDAKAKKELKIDGGIRVISIEEDGILSKARVRKNYIITHINDTEIRSTKDLSKITGPIKSLDGVYPDGRAASYSLIKE